MPTSIKSSGFHPLRLFALAVAICIVLYVTGVLFSG